MYKAFTILLLCLGTQFFSVSPLAAQESDSTIEKAKKLAQMLSSKDTPYLRVVKGKKNSRLETACVTFENLDTGLSVTLVSAVHIADASYYKLLQKHLSAYDTVFYEGVKPDGPRTDLMTLVSQLQTALKDVLGLTFQPEQMDMKKKNMVHADLKASELEAMVKKNGISLLPNQDLLKMFGPMVQAGLRMLAPNPGQEPNALQLLIQKRLKGVFAEALSKGIQLYDKFKKPEDKLRDQMLIGSRNKVVLRLLKKATAQKPNGKFAILYGGAHHPDFEKHLIADFGMQKTGTVWLPAWRIDGSDATPTLPKSKPTKAPKSKTKKKKKTVL